MGGGGGGWRLITNTVRGVVLGATRETRSHARPPVLGSSSIENLQVASRAAPGVASRKYYFGAAGFKNEILEPPYAVWKPHVSREMPRARTAGIHMGRTLEAAPTVEPTYGVGPTMETHRDPASKGSTPDDFRAEDVHMTEPKEVTKANAAVAQEEPEDFQVAKITHERQQPVEEEAKAQREPGDKVFEGATRKVEGTAEKQGDTKGTESDKMEAQYGASVPPAEDTGESTSRG